MLAPTAQGSRLWILVVAGLQRGGLVWACIEYLEYSYVLMGFLDSFRVGDVFKDLWSFGLDFVRCVGRLRIYKLI